MLDQRLGGFPLLSAFKLFSLSGSWDDVPRTTLAHCSLQRFLLELSQHYLLQIYIKYFTVFKQEIVCNSAFSMETICILEWFQCQTDPQASALLSQIPGIPSTSPLTCEEKLQENPRTSARSSFKFSSNISAIVVGKSNPDSKFTSDKFCFRPT